MQEKKSDRQYVKGLIEMSLDHRILLYRGQPKGGEPNVSPLASKHLFQQLYVGSRRISNASKSLTPTSQWKLRFFGVSFRLALFFVLLNSRNTKKFRKMASFL
jgi:hypothetical protein